jgi:hypothetical protein
VQKAWSVLNFVFNPRRWWKARYPQQGGEDETGGRAPSNCVSPRLVTPHRPIPLPNEMVRVVTQYHEPLPTSMRRVDRGGVGTLSVQPTRVRPRVGTSTEPPELWLRPPQHPSTAAQFHWPRRPASGFKPRTSTATCRLLVYRGASADSIWSLLCYTFTLRSYYSYRIYWVRLLWTMRRVLGGLSWPVHAGCFGLRGGERRLCCRSFGIIDSRYSIYQ